MQVQPYLSFEGRAEEAIEFYKKAVGAKVTMLMRNSESPEKPPPGMLPPGSEQKDHALRPDDRRQRRDDRPMGASRAIRSSTASRCRSPQRTTPRRRRLFNNLADGGQVTLPLNKTFFASSFGMVADKFGVHWMVSAGPTNP